MITLSTDKESYHFGDDVIITITSKHEKGDKLHLTSTFSSRLGILTASDDNDVFTKVIQSPHFDQSIGKNYLFQVIHKHEVDQHAVQTDIKYGLADVITKKDSEFPTEITITLDDTEYSLDDKIIVNGTTPKEYVWNTIHVRVFDPKDNQITGYNAIVDKDGKFDVIIPTQNFVTNGEYRIELGGTYTNNIIETTLQYFRNHTAAL